MGFIGFDDMQNRFVPVLVKSFEPKKDWQLIAGGQHHTVAIDGEGKYCWSLIFSIEPLYMSSL